MDGDSEAEWESDSDDGEARRQGASKRKSHVKGPGGSLKGKRPQGTDSASAAAAPHAAPTPPVVVRSATEGLAPCFTTQGLSTQTTEGLRAAACLSLRAHISERGTRLKGNRLPAVTPLPGATPSSVILTRSGVVPLLRRAVLAGRVRAEGLTGDAAAHALAVAASTEDLVRALFRKGNTAAVQALGVTPLFNLQHASLEALLRKHGATNVPGEPLYTGGGVRIVFPVVRFVRGLERTGAQVKPGRLFSWLPGGQAWLRSACPRGHNGAGVRTLSRDWKAWRMWTPGPYDPEGVPEHWQPWQEDATCVVIDPGVVLVLACHDGRVLSKAEWHRARATWRDFVRKPAPIRLAEAKLGKVGASAQAPGLHTFLRYAAAFHKAYPSAAAYYSSSAKVGGREYKQDKLRSLLTQLLNELAPRPQARGTPPLAQDCAACVLDRVVCAGVHYASQ